MIFSSETAIDILNNFNLIDTSSDDLYLTLYSKTSMGDGYQSNNPWLQELPDPISKVTWDNYLTISPVHAKKLGIKNWHVANGGLNGDLLI